MNYVEYITSSLAKSSMGASLSVMLFVIVGLYAGLGILYGIQRGLTQSLIRFFTVAASAYLALTIATTASSTIVLGAMGASGEAQSLEAMLNSYSPELINAIPEMVRPIIGEISAETATVFAMMFISILVTPVLFIGVFFILRLLTMIVYKLLASLAGAIGYGKGMINTLLGAAVGLAQGLLIAAVIIIPVSGLCTIADEAREPLLDNSQETNDMILGVYENYVDDLADNPLFELVDKFGGNDIYEQMITISINGHEYNMGDECIGVTKICIDALPLTADFNWKHPTEEQKQAFNKLIDDVGQNELISSLSADVMRGLAVSINNGNINLGLTGASNALVTDVMNLFATCTKDTIDDDFHLFVDIYFIMCDRDLIESFSGGNSEAIRAALTDKNGYDKTPVDAILTRLNEYDRAQPIVTSFTKLSITVMMGTSEFDEDTQQIYDDVKEDIITVLNHSKSDFETEEEYKEAVSADLDKALADNNIEIEEEIKNSMVDYIAENYGDHEGEITDKEINDAILSYYQSYTDYINSGKNPEDITPDDILGGNNPEDILGDKNPEDILGDLEK